MTTENSPLSQNKIDETCPFLGLYDDPQSTMGYPSLQNYCHKVKPKAAPCTAYQREYCLSNKHQQCELFTNTLDKGMPEKILGIKNSKSFLPSSLPWYLGGGLLILLVAGIVWFSLNYALAPSYKPSPSPVLLQTLVATLSTAQVTEVVDLTSSASLENSPSVELSSTFTPTIEPSSTIIPTLEPPHLFKTPFGSEPQFVLHKVIGGESLMWISEMYHTNPDSIRAVNYNLQNELWADSILIIPLNTNDVKDVIPMTAFNITVDGLSVEALAKEQGVNLEDLQKLNNRPLDYQFEIGEWVILPHSLVTPTPTPTITETPAITSTPTITTLSLPIQ